jgi:hypothetical protein
MTQEALKKMYQLLLTEPHAPTVCVQLERIAREALADHAMQAAQRLGQEIEQEPVISKWVLREVYFDEDGEPVMHRSPPQPEQEPVAIKRMKEWIEYLKRKSDFGQHMKIPSEMSAGACWELAIELEQFINTHPPQRTEQAPAVYSSFGLMGGDAFVSGDSLKRNIT